MEALSWLEKKIHPFAYHIISMHYCTLSIEKLQFYASLWDYYKSDSIYFSQDQSSCFVLRRVVFINNQSWYWLFSMFTFSLAPLQHQHDIGICEEPVLLATINGALHILQNGQHVRALFTESRTTNKGLTACQVSMSVVLVLITRQSNP